VRRTTCAFCKEEVTEGKPHDCAGTEPTNEDRLDERVEQISSPRPRISSQPDEDPPPIAA